MRRAARAAVLLIAAGLASAPADAIETRTVRVSAEVSGHGRTPERARAEALQRARDRAVAEAAGIRIAAQQLRVRSEGAGPASDRFSYVVHASTSGRIVREQAEYRTVVVGDVPVYRVTLTADVELEEGDRDPGFVLDMDVVPDGAVVRDGETVEIALTPTRASYLTLLHLDPEGHVTVLFPNRWDRGNRVEAGATWRVPGPERGFEVVAERAGAGGEERSRLLAVATLDPVPFVPAAGDGEELVPDSEADVELTALNRWLLRIPVDRRAESFWEVDIVDARGGRP